VLKLIACNNLEYKELTKDKAAKGRPSQLNAVPKFIEQFYPNGNCQNKGPNSPYTGDYQLRNEIRGAYAAGVSPCALGADYYIGRGGRRYACN